MTITPVNVRAEPSTAAGTLGIVAASVTVQITGKDIDGSWYQIIYLQAKGGIGWVTAAYVQVKAGAEIPVIGAAAGSGSGASAVVVEQVYVRNGPGTDYNSIGSLNAHDVVQLTGKNADGMWLEIGFAGAPGGKGWIAAAYVQRDNVEELPVIGSTNPATVAETPASLPSVSAVPTTTVGPMTAMPDGDSAQSPAVNVTFAPGGVHSFQYSSDVSLPSGDAEDWVEFTPYAPSVSMRLECNGVLIVELWQNGQMVQTIDSPCGGQRILNIQTNRQYFLRLEAPKSSASQYTHYTLWVESNP